MPLSRSDVTASGRKMQAYKLVNGIPRPNFSTPPEGRAQYVTDGKDTGVVIIFKAASRSMVATGEERNVFGGRAEDLPKNMHVFVREPLQRLKSAYNFFKAHPPIDGRTKRGPMSYEEFVDHVLDDDARNPHWRSVTETLSVFGRSDIVPHLFENLSDEYPIGALERRNVSKPIEGKEVDTSYREDELKEFYAGDYKLREQAA